MLCGDTIEDSTKERIVRELRSALGEESVFHEETDLMPYTRDTFALRFSEEDRHLPDLVVLPSGTEDVAKAIRIAAEHSIPVIPKGGGTSRTGMLVPIRGGMILDTIRMNSLLKLDRLDQLVRVQAGINLLELDLLLRKQGLTLGHEQGSQKIATIGGAISTAAYSRKNHMYGNLWERIASLTVVLGDGTILSTGPDVPYSSSGVNLAGIFVGAEGTLGVITEATLRIEPLPEVTLPVLALFSDFVAAENAVNKIMSSSISFVGGSVWEDERGFSDLDSPSHLAGMILALEGCREEVNAGRSRLETIIGEEDGIIIEQSKADEHWDEFLMHWCGMRSEVGYEDVIVSFVPRSRKEEYFRKLIDDILPRHGLTPLPGEKKNFDFGRHMIFATRFTIPHSDEGWEAYIAGIDEASKLITSLGGTIAACHGVGLLHREHIENELGANYVEVIRRLKGVMDPQGIMNPGKKFSL